MTGGSGVATRVAAAENLHRILGEGAHSNVLLDQPGEFQGRDRAVVQRLTLDTLRWLPLVDWRIEAMAERNPADLDPKVRTVVRIALTELHLGGDPHGVVNSAVEATRVLGMGRATGFVNAICRRFARGDVPQPPEAIRPALELGSPPWIWDSLAALFGSAETAALIAALNEPAPIGIRLRGNVHDPPGEGVPGIPGARLLSDRREVVNLGSAAMVMDPASTAVVDAVEARPGDRVLDVAAAPGNKTAALWDAMESEGLLVAADAHSRRTKRARRRMQRLDVGATWVTADGARPPFRIGTFDRILLDAPCTGLGTVRRRPEIKLRLDPSAPKRMGEMQRGLLEASLPLLRPGGRLVYSVCTMFAEETVEVIAGLDAQPPDLPGMRLGDGVLMAPHLTNTDGMFVAVIDG